MKKISALTLLLFCFSMSKLSAQTNRKVSGVVIDSAKKAVAHAKVVIIYAKDTLNTQTDEYGDFSLTRINADKFTIKISHVGYQDYQLDYSFQEKERHKKLDQIMLKADNRMLDEVVITAKPNPVRFMLDTVEYNAAAFRVNEGDNVADLIKQFPGMEVGSDYGVKTMGKEMVKLRVNGEDFFTSDIKEFIGKLPAGIVSKIQVIDDFGDQANFTGIKTGEPIKMLNIVTKPGMNKGGFGNYSGNAGTNDMIGTGGSFNLWNGTKQSTVSLSANTANNGAGTNSNMSGGISHRDKINKSSRGGFGYNFSRMKNAFARDQIIESINTEGNFINNSTSEGDNGSSSHMLNGDLNYNNKKIYFNGSFNAGYSRQDNQNSSLNRQSGIFRQDLNNENTSKNQSPNLSSNFNFSRILKNKQNSFSGQGSYSMSSSNGNQNISTNTLYYDKNTGVLQKDSLLNRELENQSSNQHFNFGFNYSLSFKKGRDSLARRSLNFNYDGSASQSKNLVSTYVFDNTSDKVSFVDSLSTSFKSTTLAQSLGINYNFSNRKSRYNLGLNARPTLLTNKDLRLKSVTKNNTFNYAPSLNYSRNFTQGKTLSMTYNGSNNNPSIYQLQPIRNSQSLQNIIVGNPDLKPSFRHSVNANFNYSNLKSRRSLQVGLNASVTQREIVDNVSFIPDTLNSLKQITRYENVNGNYQISSNYNFHIPFSKNKNAIRYSGSIGLSNRAVFFNNQKAFGKGFNFSQAIGSNVTIKKLSLNTELNYSITSNNNATSFNRSYEYQPIGIGLINAPAFFMTKSFRASLSTELQLKTFSMSGSTAYSTNRNDGEGAQSIQDITNIDMNIYGRLTIKKSYFFNFGATKRINYGYALENSNPLIINAGLQKGFLKNKSLRFGLNANDLLAQGNNLSRFVSGNTIIDSRNKQQTRVISLNLSYSLSKFGGRNFRVDPDY